MNNFEKQDFQDALSKAYMQPPQDLVVDMLRQLSDQKAETIFMDLYVEFIHESLDKDKFKTLLILFSKAGKDLSFLSRNFIAKCYGETDYVTYPLPEYISQKERQYRVNFFPIYTSLYKDTHRIPKLDRDLRDYVQGFVTGYAPREIDSERAEKQKLLAFIQRDMPYSGASLEWSLEQLQSLAKTIRDERLRIEKADLIMRIKMLNPWFKPKPADSIDYLRGRLKALQKGHAI